MRLSLIGKIVENREIVAFKVYDAENKVYGVYPTEAILEQVSKGVNIIGVRRTKDEVKLLRSQSYTVNKLEILNGKGDKVLIPTGMYNLIGYTGFLEDTKYRIVNALGEDIYVNKEQFMELLSKDLINGARLSRVKEGKININPQCRVREYLNGDLEVTEIESVEEHMGYEEEFNWDLID